MKPSEFETLISDQAYYKSWKPPGELWKTIESGGQTHEIWRASLADLAVQQMLKRIQILVPLFIEGGSLIDLDEPEWSLERWTVFFLYAKTGLSHSPYMFMGYSTVYRYFLYQPITLTTSLEKKRATQQQATFDFQLPVTEKVPFSSLPCRSRISQFVILPPFQRGGNGSRFYNAIFEFYFKQPQTIEITVEDPNAEFDDLRDINDLTYLRTIPEFTALKINHNAIARSKGLVPRDILDLDELEKLRVKVKIAPRQFYRVVEMQLLSLIPLGVRKSQLIKRPTATGAELKALQHIYHLWQLFVKKRLYRHNKDTLMQLDRAERIDKLEDALGSVEIDYARLLDAADSRSRANAKSDGASMNGTGNETAKRSSPDEAGEEPASKKIKLTEA